MSRTFDVAVVGLGAIGSAALDHLARAGIAVVGFDAHEPPHDLGSSHGKSRIIREAYFEDPLYVPLVRRAYDEWDRLERDLGTRLRLTTGGIMIGPREGVLVAGAIGSAETHHLEYELLDAAELHRRFPAFHPDPRMVGVWEPRAGVLLPERCIEAHLARAQRAGAVLRKNEPVLGWRDSGDGVEVTSARETLHVGQLVLAAGAWMPRLMGGLVLPLKVERVVQAWFQPVADRAALAPERCPITIWEYASDRFFYAFPLLEGVVKAALHHQGRVVDPDKVDRTVADREIEQIRAPLGIHIPGANGPLRQAAVCLYTNTPDGHFVIDRHPSHEKVLIVSACSGHGFKFASALGAAIAELVRDGRSRSDLSRFGLARLLGGASGRDPAPGGN